ncbi:hypothetical protein pb186bvf_006489 [Paramecium bursaria]
MEKRLKELNENADDYIKKCKETKNKSIREIQQYSQNYQEKFKQEIKQLKSKNKHINPCIEQFEKNLKELNNQCYSAKQVLYSQAILSARGDRRVEESIIENSTEYQEIIANMEIINFDEIYLQERQHEIDNIEKMAKELHSLVNKLNELVDQQGEQLDYTIEKLQQTKQNLKDVYKSQAQDRSSVLPRTSTTLQFPRRSTNNQQGEKDKTAKTEPQYQFLLIKDVSITVLYNEYELILLPSLSIRVIS